MVDAARERGLAFRLETTRVAVSVCLASGRVLGRVRSGFAGNARRTHRAVRQQGCLPGAEAEARANPRTVHRMHGAAGSHGRASRNHRHREELDGELMPTGFKYFLLFVFLYVNISTVTLVLAQRACGPVPGVPGDPNWKDRLDQSSCIATAPLKAYAWPLYGLYLAWNRVL